MIQIEVAVGRTISEMSRLCERNLSITIEYDVGANDRRGCCARNKKCTPLQEIQVSICINEYIFNVEIN